MNNFLYAMSELFENMKAKIHEILDMSSYTEQERNDLFLVVGSCLQCISDYAERIDINEDDKDLKNVVSAFRYANNSLKHNIEVTTIVTQRGEVTFPIHFPLAIPKKEVVWSIKDSSINKFENQRMKYEECLKGRDVIETCREVIKELKDYEL